MLRALHLYWRDDARDVDLGVTYYDTVPRTGELISHSTEHGGVWRVVFVYHQGTVVEGSRTYRDFAEGRPHAPLRVTLFVIPVPGPFRDGAAGDDDE